LDALVEVHDTEEIARAADAGATLIGVNNRDLRTLHVDVETCLKLVDSLPAGVVKVAESGIRSRAQIDRLMAAGYEAFLVGEELMRAADPGDALWRMLQPES
ncbi:MAG TPA: indole-3-glycerol-phosphate synthase TrpC, partial [Candidatus Polarisedimenticolia bacterium]|nr:indole-3-glycerol-phosphate synthase TrpC [Candidatus Polarisedimenticolia bacterium]